MRTNRKLKVVKFIERPKLTVNMHSKSNGSWIRFLRDKDVSKSSAGKEFASSPQKISTFTLWSCSSAQLGPAKNIKNAETIHHFFMVKETRRKRIGVTVLTEVT